MEGSKDGELMRAERQNNQLELAFGKRKKEPVHRRKKRTLYSLFDREIPGVLKSALRKRKK